MPINLQTNGKNENPAAFSFIHSSARRSANRRALLVIRGFEQVIFPKQALLSLQEKVTETAPLPRASAQPVRSTILPRRV